MTTNRDALEAAAAYWASELQIETKREEFRLALLPLLQAEWNQYCAPKPVDDRWYFTKVDYDPQGQLLEALHAVGIPCGGFMFSADGLFYAKTSCTIREGRVEVREGRGAPFRLIYCRPNEIEAWETDGGHP